MRSIKIALILATLGAAAPSLAVVRPVAANLSSGARAGTPIAHKSKLVGGAPIFVAIAAAGVVGGGVYIATKHDHHDFVSP